MRGIKRCFTVILTILLIALTVACTHETTSWPWGKVIKISGTLPALVRSSGATFGNESVKLGEQSLVYMVRDENGEIYTFDVAEGGSVARATLLTRVCIGTYISFRTVLVPKGDYIPNPRVGTELAENIHVPTPCTE